ncbi:hypothetical protein BACPEC_03008 [[Bacteroides] pectinophilus ATCC 43243]|uniref:Uncharacterized protein n=1 Tax=[Bacteroides] pectinophilus ATCC 43243 TaxID=483218 RepID=B7AWA8_9FIRM|nr:hypothetical protein BACPEC_03008 [[Bacteroides] pectinophilus ATCC 43243]
MTLIIISSFKIRTLFLISHNLQDISSISSCCLLSSLYASNACCVCCIRI